MAVCAIGTALLALVAGAGLRGDRGGLFSHTVVPGPAPTQAPIAQFTVCPSGAYCSNLVITGTIDVNAPSVACGLPERSPGTLETVQVDPTTGRVVCISIGSGH